MLQRLLRASKPIVFRLRLDLIKGCQASARLLSPIVLHQIAYG